MENISYHKAGLEDIQILVDNRIEFALELTGEQAPESVEHLMSQMKNYFERAISNNNCISYIAKYENEIAGIGTVTIREQPGNFKNPSGRWGYVMNMYTKPSFRNNGICTSILKLLIEDCRQMGINSFELHATKKGEPVYLKNGFNFHVDSTLRKYLMDEKK